VSRDIWKTKISGHDPEGFEPQSYEKKPQPRRFQPPPPLISVSKQSKYTTLVQANMVSVPW